MLVLNDQKLNPPPQMVQTKFGHPVVPQRDVAEESQEVALWPKYHLWNWRLRS